MSRKEKKLAAKKVTFICLKMITITILSSNSCQELLFVFQRIYDDLMAFFLSLYIQAKYLAEQAEMENDSQFSLSQQEQTAKGAMMENATDIKV